jgi:hypothetical protein
MVVPGAAFGAAVSLRGATRARFTGTTQVNRKDSGVSLERPLDGGGAIVSDTFSITIAVEIVLTGAGACASRTRQQRR